jgi:hypothetical protein
MSALMPLLDIVRPWRTPDQQPNKIPSLVPLMSARPTTNVSILTICGSKTILLCAGGAPMRLHLTLILHSTPSELVILLL